MPISTFSDPTVSLWQSAIRDVLAAEQPPAGDGVLGIDDAPLPSEASATHQAMLDTVLLGEAFTRGEALDGPQTLGIVDECAKRYFQLVMAEARGDDERAAAIKEELGYSTCDPLWAKCLVEFKKYALSHAAIPYRRHQHMDDFVRTLPAQPNLTVAIIGDWGTGMPEAKRILQQVAQHNPDVVIHLGDIYYSGTQREADENFLQIFQQVFAGRVPIYTLTGNHDMYSGGTGYYWLLDQIGQPASYFALRNEHWQILGLDTSYHDFNPGTVLSNCTFLEPSEAAWHLDKIHNAGGRRTIVLSHHQLFSNTGSLGENSAGQYMAVNPKLRETFRDVLGQIDLWVWGHEHNLLVYDPYIGLERGRCVGSGAVPIMVDQHPYEVNPKLVYPDDAAGQLTFRDQARLGDDGETYNHAYTILNLERPQRHRHLLPDADGRPVEQHRVQGDHRRLAAQAPRIAPATPRTHGWRGFLLIRGASGMLRGNTGPLETPCIISKLPPRPRSRRLNRAGRSPSPSPSRPSTKLTASAQCYSRFDVSAPRPSCSWWTTPAATRPRPRRWRPARASCSTPTTRATAPQSKQRSARPTAM